MRYGQRVIQIAAVVFVMLAASGAQAAIYTYEMGIAPDKEAIPMTRVENGFGGGDPLGSMAVFSDNSVGDAPGFYLTNLGSIYTIDMRVRADVNPMGTTGYTARSMGIADTDNKGIGIQIRKDGLWFVDKQPGSNASPEPDVINAKIAVDLTSLREIRIVVNGGNATVYDLSGGSAVLLGTVPLVITEALVSGAANEIADGTGGMHLNSLQDYGTYLGQFTLDWLRIDQGTDRGTGAVIPGPTPSGCGIVVGPNANQASVPVTPCFSDSFDSYTPGPLVGQGGWTGTATGTEIVVDNTSVPTQSVKMNLGAGGVEAAHSVTCDGDIVRAIIKIKKGTCSTGCGNFAWAVWFDDANGNNLARWYGSESGARPRIGGQARVLASQTLTGNWDELRVDIKTLTGYSEFFFNGAFVGELQWGDLYTTTATGVANVRLERWNRSDTAGTINFDDLELSTLPCVPCARLARATVLQGSSSPTPGLLNYRVENVGTSTVNYTAVESPDVTWLSLDNATGSLDPGAVATVTANIVNTSGLAKGTYLTSVRFADGCVPANTWDGLIVLTVGSACQWHIRPYNNAWIPWCEESSPARAYSFLIYNDGTVPFNYTVEVTGETGALTLDKSEGTVAANSTDVITVTSAMGTAMNAGADRPATITVTNTTTGCESSFAPAPTLASVWTVKDRTEGGNDDVPPGGWGYELMDLQYHGDAEPDAVNAGGPGITFQLMAGGTKVGQVVDDPQALGGKAYRIQTAGAAEFWGAKNPRTGDALHQLGNGAIGDVEGTTLVARVKVVSENGSGKTLAVTNKNIETEDQRINSASIHWDGSVDPNGKGYIEELDYYNENRLVEVPGTGDGQYHIIRLAAGRNLGRPSAQTVKIWVDENPTPVISFTSSGHQPWLNSHPSWWFGVSEANTGTDIYFDWVTGTNAGMFGPGEDDGCASNNRSPGGDPPVPTPDRPSTVHDLTPTAMPTGACCLPFGQGCSQTDYAGCAATKGYWGGYGSVCGDYTYGGTCTGYGACCLPGGTCQDNEGLGMLFDECLGLFMGQESTCATSTCVDVCNDPFADADQDTDVDQMDFAVLQQCYTGGAALDGTYPPYCVCFDVRDATGQAGTDNAITSFDVTAFELCASGPGIAANETCTGN